VEDRDYFFGFEWRFVPLLVLAVIAALYGEGPAFVLIAVAATLVLGGAYFMIWRWWRTRRGQQARFRK
jgi:hypothetical protein